MCRKIIFISLVLGTLSATSFKVFANSSEKKSTTHSVQKSMETQKQLDDKKSESAHNQNMVRNQVEQMFGAYLRKTNRANLNVKLSELKNYFLQVDKFRKSQSRQRSDVEIYLDTLVATFETFPQTGFTKVKCSNYRDKMLSQFHLAEEGEPQSPRALYEQLWNHLCK